MELTLALSELPVTSRAAFSIKAFISAIPATLSALDVALELLVRSFKSRGVPTEATTEDGCGPPAADTITPPEVLFT